MPRSTRAAAGGVVVLVLLLVAAVSGLVAVVAGAQVRGEGWSAAQEVPAGDWFTDPVEVEAEVLDVDADQDGFGWAALDVAYDTQAGREVTVVDLGERGEDSPPLPQVGDTIAVVHERSDPSYALRADDPLLTGETVDGEVGPTAEEARAAAEAVAGRMRTLALVSLGLGLLAGAATVVAVRRAPPPRTWRAEPVDGPTEAASRR